MKQDDKFTVINVREYLRENDNGEEQFGEDDLRQMLSEFSCEKKQVRRAMHAKGLSTEESSRRRDGDEKRGL